MTNAPASTEELPGPELMPERYQVLELLGRGGMACVYRVKDRANHCELALKRLLLDQRVANRNAVSGLFEREFHTLAHLSHPHVIAVHDYGLFADGNPYYTMELLDGGDLRDRSPLPWRELCRLLFDVCSSLALLHSRRLLHRDISPRNIRCTQDGRAKLIDFGAMAPMNAGGAEVVGTPAFVAPETLQRSALDARTDLFSLGATFYFGLTGRVPYPARTFADVVTAWRSKVVAPSSWVPEIPSALDDLVLSLLQVEPALRPRSAFEVMQRLAAIAGLQAGESQAVSRAYLATPTLVGRESALEHFRDALLASRLARGGALCLEGPAGAGRSRLLDACALEAKTLGFTVLRASAGAAREPFSTVRDLTRHLLKALPASELASASPESFVPAADGEPSGPTLRPSLRDCAAESVDAEQLQLAVCQLWMSVSRKHPLLLAVDDVHRIDAASAAVLVALLDKARRAGIFVVLTADSEEPATEASSALRRRCRTLSVTPLTLGQMHRLLGSLFGETANLDMLAEELDAIAQGNPRQCMELAQHLVDRGVIQYAAGTWSLPNRLSNEDLPRSAEAAKRARIACLSPNARQLAQCQALAFYEELRGQDHHALLPGASSAEIETALAELVAAGIATGDGATYALSNRLWRAALSDSIPASELAPRHAALAVMFKESSRIAFIYHAFAGDMDELALDALMALNAQYASEIDHEQVVEQNVGKMMECYPRAHQAAERLGKSLRERNELRRWHLAGTASRHEVSYPDSARAWFEQLEHDSGLALYRADPDSSDASQRLMRALTRAQQRYLETPEPERVYSVEEAIRLLAEYVVFCIVIAVRSQDFALLKQLPPILEPLSSLSPVLHAIWQNALACYETGVEAAFEKGRARWTAVLIQLDALGDSDVKYAKEIATAIAFGIGCVEAQLGLATASKWAQRLDRDVYQRLSALQLQRVERLAQGDGKNAERLRRQAELLALRSRGPQMFTTLVAVELNACAGASDLSGVRDALERIRPLAQRYPGWVPNLLYAEGCFDHVRGDYEAAKAKYDECIALTAFDAHGESLNAPLWFAAHYGLGEAWLALGDPARACDAVRRALELAEQRGMASNLTDLVRVRALAEAKLGMPNAVERLERVISEQHRLGVTGLQLGRSYEARAQIAIWQEDSVAFERYAELTAREYRYGAGSMLGTRYNRLVNEAARHGLRARAKLTDFPITSTSAHESGQLTTDDPRTIVERMMLGARDADERAQVALELICAGRNASGYLFTTSATGLVLSASRGSLKGPPDLDVLREFIARWEDREDAIDDMTTGERVDEAPCPTTVVHGAAYELLLLSSVVDGVAKVAGVAAIAGSNKQDGARQTQLLQALATHLLQVGEGESAAEGR